MTKITPTYGYAKDGSAQIFDLKDDEKLPEGWFDSPQAAADAAASTAPRKSAKR